MEDGSPGLDRPPLDLLLSFLIPLLSPTRSQKWEETPRWGQEGGRGCSVRRACIALTTLGLCCFRCLKTFLRLQALSHNPSVVPQLPTGR